MKVQINGDVVILFDKIKVSMDGYFILNSTGAVDSIKFNNGTWTVKGKNSKRMSLQRFILTNGGKVDLEKGTRVIRKNKNINDLTTKNLKAVNNYEYTLTKLLLGKKNSEGTGVKYVKWNETEQQYEARIALCNGHFKTERFKDIELASIIVHGLQKIALEHAKQIGDIKYYNNRKRKWNL